MIGKPTMKFGQLEPQRPRRPLARGAWLLALSIALTSGSAWADVTSTYAVSSGFAYRALPSRSSERPVSSVSPLLGLDLGLGTTPLASFVFEGLLHMDFPTDWGGDFGGGLRLATGPYARGEWGFALDLLSEYRVAEIGGAQGTARLILGSPWGFFLGVEGNYGEGEAAGFGCTLGFDFARVTVHRRKGTDLVPSPLASPDPREIPSGER